MLEIEVQGALQVKQKCPDALLVFVMPPLFEELRRRLTDRGTEDGATVERRLANAAREMEAAKHYDYIVVNQTVEDAADPAGADCMRGQTYRKIFKRIY